MGFYRSVEGMIRVECVSADTSALLDCILRENITVSDVVAVDDLTVQFTLSRLDYRNLTAIIGKRGEQIRILRKRGIFWILMSGFGHPILLTGIVLLLAATMIIPTRILFIRVEGNTDVPDREILEAAERSGLYFGASRRNLRSEQIKNRLLDEIALLKWAGVNTYGCEAVITVREREIRSEPEENETVRHITAGRDGIITSCTVTNGNGLCSVGQAVKRGDILISGFTDCGIAIRAECAEGTVFAETNRDLTVITPSDHLIRTEKDDTETKISLLIGKKRINFFKGSGISCSRCVKMTMKYVLTLPGDFQLPVSLIIQRWSDCQLTEEAIVDPELVLHSFADCYLYGQMLDGTVVRKEESVQAGDGVVTLHGVYACIENIGIATDEKIGEFNGKTDGADRKRGSGG